jgi:two-component system OmpR family response regulator
MMTDAQGDSRPQVPGVPSGTKHILLVDDVDAILAPMSRYFRNLGYDVDCAREREEAEALLSHVRYDCLIADLCLTTGHGPDGLAVIGHAHEASPVTRIVVLTAAESSDTEGEALRLGADVFLRKPTPLTEVARAVAGLVGHS